MKLHVLHISSDFAKQDIYNQLVSNLEFCGVARQYVYVPVRSEAELGINCNRCLQRTIYKYSHILRPYHRMFFRSKINTAYADLLQCMNIASTNVVHAHFVFSDGSIAFRLYQEYSIPYVVAVRNTDLNVFFRFRPDLRWHGWSILNYATNVIFISPCYLQAMLELAPRNYRSSIREKARIIPNGVTSDWLETPKPISLACPPRIRLLYVGDFSRNKNVRNTIMATEELRQSIDVTLTLVGGSGNSANRIHNMLGSGRFPFVEYRGQVSDKAALRAIYREHDIFVMPSYTETFGVAYIEALSQGLPIIYSRGQGVDGYFEEGTVGEPTDPTDVSQIASSILSVINRLDRIRTVCSDVSRRFDWTAIAGEHIEMYQNAVDSNTEWKRAESQGRSD